MPLDYLPYLAGGVFIGLASGGLYLLAGEIAGITGIVRSTLLGPKRSWQAAFVAGMLCTGLIGAATQGHLLVAGLEKIGVPMLILAGLFVGVGTDISYGCTSGHGVCGLSRLSKRSFVAVPVFMLAAAITLFLVRHGGLR